MAKGFNVWTAVAVTATVCATYSAGADTKEGNTVASSSPARVEELNRLIEKARWIWHPDGAGQVVVHFRKILILDEKPIISRILITADNGYELYVNGSLVGTEIGVEQAYWQSVELYDLTALLTTGTNVIAVRATDLGGERGLLAAVEVELPQQRPFQFFTDETWRASAATDPTGFARPEFGEDATWQLCKVLGPNGSRPWGLVTYPGVRSPHHGKGAAVHRISNPTEKFEFPAGVVFVRGRVSETSTSGAQQAIWRINQSRAYLELDVLGPGMPGRALYSLIPARPDGTVKLLLNAGKGLVGSPSVSFDGQQVYFSFAPEGENFFHIYRISTNGGTPEALTSGPFHDFDPEPLPDGQIIFSSTRIGAREEYHGNAARSLFVMTPEGGDIRAITHHIVGDMEPKVTADGNIAFIRQDNFMERAKVETQIHLIRPDGTAGQVLFGANRSALGYNRAHAAEEDGFWLRHYGFGSIAPLADGRIACISSYGILIGRSGDVPSSTIQPAVGLVDLAPLPDGRLLCTIAGQSGIGVLDPSNGEVTRIYSQPPFDMHSVLYLGARGTPPVLRSTTEIREGQHSTAAEHTAEPTGFLIGQNVFYTKQTNADLSRIKAIRVIQGTPFSLRSARHQYAHLGVEAMELGTAPVAPDGSFFIEVPADRALALQAVDAEGRSVINEMSWIYVRPGERRSCVGCHSPREGAPPNARAVLALRTDPVRLLGNVADRKDAHRFRGNNAANGGVLNLQFDRFREAASINLHTLSTGGRPGEVKGLAEMLKTGSSDQKISAAQKLAIFRDRIASSVLARALDDDHPAVRMYAALALASCGNRESVPPLVGALDVRNKATGFSPSAAQAAHIALEHLTGHNIVFNAYDSQPDKGIAKWQAWLKENSWEAIEAEQIRRLSSTEPVQVLDAIETLGHVGGSDAALALRTWLEQDPGQDLRASIAAMRGLGHMKDPNSVPLLKRIFVQNAQKRAEPAAGNHEFGWTQRPVQLAAAAAEALGSIGTPEAEQALLEGAEKLREFWYYTFENGDHDWLMGCHSSLPHYRIAEALDAIGTRLPAGTLAIFLRSVPIDTDRALLFENDAYEVVISRLIHRSGLAREIIQTCLRVLGDGIPREAGNLLQAAVTQSPPAVSVGPLCAESRAAQLLSMVCVAEDAAGIEAAFNRYRGRAPSRTRSWVCFYLARALGKLRQLESSKSLIAALDQDPTEGTFGTVDPPNVFLNEAMTPCYRAAAAYSLGLIQDRRVTPALIRTVADFSNAMDVRYAAAHALLLIGDPTVKSQLKQSRWVRDYPEVTTRRILLQACASTVGQASGLSPEVDGTRALLSTATESR